MENPTPDNDNGNGNGNPPLGAAVGFSYLTRRPLMSRTFMQVAFFEALFGEEPLRSYCAQFIPPHLLSINGSNESSGANESQSGHNSQFPFDSTSPVEDDDEHRVVEVANGKDDSGELGEVRREEVSNCTSQEEMIDNESTQLACNANICLDIPEIIIGESTGMKGMELGTQAVADGIGSGDVSEHLMNCQEHLSNIEKALMDESPKIGQLPLDIEDGSTTVSEAIKSFLDMDLFGDAIRQVAGRHDGTTSVEGITMGEQGDDKQENDMEIEKHILSAPMTSESQLTRPDPIFYTRDQLLKFRQVASVPEDILKINLEIDAELHGVHHNQADKQNRDADVSQKTRRARKQEKGKKKEPIIIEKRKVEGIVEDDEKLKKQGPIIIKKRKVEGIVEDDEKLKKEAADTSHKRKKRGPVAKEKKKQKERKRRAEKNRELGVKRLKIQPILKPKTVSICRHYHMGRCNEGEKCKFSHDVIPLTKSKPCCHFARQACMKGESCPFDHELSKYPCDNYATKGFCGRRDSCLFSHKIPAKDGSESSIEVSKFEFKSSASPNQSITMEHMNPGTNNFSGINTATIMKNKVALCTPNQQAPAPKGLNFFSFDKSLVDASAKQKQLGSSAKSGNDSETSTQPTDSTGKGPRPLLPPRGITFLSFGNTSSVDASDGKQTSSLTKVEKALNSSVCDKENDKLLPSNVIPNGLADIAVSSGFSLKKFEDLPRGNTYRQFARTSSIDGHGGKQTSLPTQMEKRFDSSVHDKGNGNKLQPSNAMPHGLPNHAFSPSLSSKKLEDAPRGVNFPSFGKPSTIDDPDGRRASLPTQMEISFDSSVARKGINSGCERSNVILQGLLDRPFSPGLSSQKLEDAQARGTPNSAPRALLSTLAFAAKYESAIRNSSAGAPPSSSELSSSSGSAKNAPMNPTAIHDLLFGENSGAK